MSTLALVTPLVLALIWAVVAFQRRSGGKVSGDWVTTKPSLGTAWMFPGRGESKPKTEPDGEPVAVVYKASERTLPPGISERTENPDQH